MLEQIHSVLHGEKRGHDFHANCPFCGKLAKKGQNHFSYSDCGYICFVCGKRGGLWTLANHLGLDGTTVNIPPIQHAEKEHPRHRVGRVYPRELIALYQRSARRFAYWRRYRGLNETSVQKYQLGLGCLPGQTTTRLIIPVLHSGRCVGLRGRVLNSDQKPKWINAKGSITRFYAPGLRAGVTLWLTENCADALLLMQCYPEYYAGAPTTGAGSWLHEWTDGLAALNLEMVIVAYDNDNAGITNGHKRRAELERAGIPVVLWAWKQSDTDMGAWLMKQM